MKIISIHIKDVDLNLRTHIIMDSWYNRDRFSGHVDTRKDHRRLWNSG